MEWNVREASNCSVPKSQHHTYPQQYNVTIDNNTLDLTAPSRLHRTAPHQQEYCSKTHTFQTYFPL